MSRSRTAAGKQILNVVAAFGLIYLFVPIIFIVAFSFNNPRGRFNLVWQEFTLDNWLNPFADPGLTSAFLSSLRIAAISTLIATFLGSLMAIALSRYRFRGSNGFNFFLVLPLTAPEIVLGSSLATLFLGQNFVSFGTVTIIIAHIMFQVSFVALTVRARIRGFDWTLEQAAQDLGASPARTFWKVTFPLILPGILAASLLAFALSIDDFIITFFNSGSVQTFPIYIYGASRVEISPQINVLASMVLFASVAILAIGTFSGRRKPKVNQRRTRRPARA
jgi:spermidine/putrescine transport system permease protein